MIDDQANIRWYNNPVGVYAVGKAVMLDGVMRAPVVACMGADVHGERFAFTVPLRESMPTLPSQMPRNALRVPSHLPLRDALWLPACWPIIYMALVHRLKVRSRDAVLVHDAHTPAGMLACLLAASLDAAVLAVCDTADHARRAIAVGAVESATTISAWPELIREHGGADVVLDPAGGRYASASIICARRHARIGVMDCAQQTSFDDVQWQRVFSKQLALMAVDWSPLRDAPVANEAAAFFNEFTRTDAWTRYVNLRDTADPTNNSESAPADKLHWIPNEA